MCTSESKEDQINALCQKVAQENCAKLLESITDQPLADHRAAFLAYIDTFQNMFRSEINKKFDNVMSEPDSTFQEPWFTDYVTLKPLNQEEPKHPGSSIVAKAQKITKKACVLLHSNNHNNDNSTSTNLEESLTGMNKFSFVELYAKCVKEGHIEWTRPEKAIETTKNAWQKAKLRLVMLSAGAIIEITCSKQSNKPIWGCYASSVREIRSSSPLETPDEENAFVIRTSEKEFIVRVSSESEKSSWILMIRRVCSYQETREINTEEGINFENFIEELRLVSMSNELFRDGYCESSRSNSANTFHDEEITRTLSLYPWYHGNIRRSDSANLILHKQVRHILSESTTSDSLRSNPMSSNTSGVFLVRISGTRHGEYVLTYNYHDRAKHMRLNILSDGQCRVQHLWFNSIFDMLEHFRTEPVPMDSGGGISDVKLTSFIIKDEEGNSNEVMSYNGSVRIRTDLLNIRNGRNSSVLRAKENSYSFV